MTGQTLPVAGTRESRVWLGAELRARKAATALALAAGLLAAGTAIVPAYALGLLVDRVRSGGDTAAIIPVAVIIVVAALAGGPATGLAGHLTRGLGSRILADLRERTVDTALRLPAQVLDRVGRGDLLSRVSADITAIDKAVSDVLPSMISALLLAVISLAAIVGIDWRLGLAGAVAVPLYVLGLRWYLPRAARPTRPSASPSPNGPSSSSRACRASVRCTRTTWRTGTSTASPRRPPAPATSR